MDMSECYQRFDTMTHGQIRISSMEYDGHQILQMPERQAKMRAVNPVDRHWHEGEVELLMILWRLASTKQEMITRFHAYCGKRRTIAACTMAIRKSKSAESAFNHLYSRWLKWNWFGSDDREALRILQSVAQLNLVIISGTVGQTLWDYEELKKAISLYDHEASGSQPSVTWEKTFGYHKSTKNMRDVWLTAQFPGTICHIMMCNLQTQNSSNPCTGDSMKDFPIKVAEGASSDSKEDRKVEKPDDDIQNREKRIDQHYEGFQNVNEHLRKHGQHLENRDKNFMEQNESKEHNPKPDGCFEEFDEYLKEYNNHFEQHDEHLQERNRDPQPLEIQLNHKDKGLEDFDIDVEAILPHWGGFWDETVFKKLYPELEGVAIL